MSRLYLAHLDFHLFHSWLVRITYPQLWVLSPPLKLLGYLGLLDHLNLVADILACWRADVAGVGDIAGVLTWLADLTGTGDWLTWLADMAG